MKINRNHSTEFNTLVEKLQIICTSVLCVKGGKCCNRGFRPFWYNVERLNGQCSDGAQNLVYRVIKTWNTPPF